MKCVVSNNELESAVTFLQAGGDILPGDIDPNKVFDFQFQVISALVEFHSSFSSTSYLVYAKKIPTQTKSITKNQLDVIDCCNA